MSEETGDEKTVMKCDFCEQEAPTVRRVGTALSVWMTI